VEIAYFGLGILWEAIQWLLFAEEKLALILADHHVPILFRIVTLSLSNMLYIGVDFAIIHFFAHLKWVKNTVKKVDQGLKKMSKGRKIGLFDLFLLDLAPMMQKFGVVAFYAKKKDFGWNGFLALAAGGFCRVVAYSIMGDHITIFIFVLLALRVAILVHQNGWVNHDQPNQ
jgi:hypothetical protein